MGLFDAFIKIETITGESDDSKHKGEIEVFSFSWGVSQSGSSASGTGAGAGKAQVADFQFTKKTDKSSPILFMKCASGEHIKEANFVCRKAGGSAVEFLKYKFTDVIITSVKVQGSGAEGNEVPLEDVTLGFTKCELDYQAQGPDGKPLGGPVHGGWNMKANVVA